MGLAGVGRLDQSIALLFKISEACRNAPPERTPSIEGIISHLENSSRYALPNKETITRDELAGLRALAAVVRKIDTFDERYRLGPANGMRE
jgi:hypothetical protein